jgi:2-dehydropantoate 2-reductase
MVGSSLRIGVIGSGAIGSYLGYHLASAGFDVHFLLRGDDEAVAARGLVVTGKPYGNAAPLFVKRYRAIEDMPTCDWLLLGARSTCNANLAPLLAKVAAPSAKVVCLQSGIDNEDRLRAMLPRSIHLLGGLCWLWLERNAPGVVKQANAGELHLGYHSGESSHESQQAILEEGVRLFQSSGIKTHAISSLTEARWKMLVWTMPFHGLSALLQAGTHALTSNATCRSLLAMLMQEVIAAAFACGYTLPGNMPAKLIDATAARDDFLPTMYFDSKLQRPMELEAMYARPLAVARSAGCALPHTETLYRLLQMKETMPCVNG